MGGSLRSAGSHHESAKGLDDGVHGFAGAWIALAAETGERAVDDARIDFTRLRVSGAEAVHGAAAEVFEDHVGAADQVREYLAVISDSSD